MKLKQEIVTDGREQVDAYMGLCTGLLCVLGRLLQRKNQAFAISVGTGNDSNIGIDAKNEHDQVCNNFTASYLPYLNFFHTLPFLCNPKN